MAVSLTLAFLSGFTILLSRTLNARLSSHIGMKHTILINYLAGTIGALIVFAIGGGRIPTFDRPLTLADAPSFLGGLAGIIVVGTSAFLVPRLPAYVLTLAIFLGQLFSGMAIDLLREGRTPIGKIVGFALILAGLLVSFPGKRADAKLPDETEPTA